MTREKFRNTYGFGKSTTYVATYDDIEVDPKALLASAHHHQFPGMPLLTPYSFSSSQLNRTILEKFGCKILPSNELSRTTSPTPVQPTVSLQLAKPAATWWVNQSENFDLVFDQGTLWVPLVDDRGAVPSHWAAIHDLLPGDLVLHRHSGRIRGLSTVISTPSPQRRPSGYTSSNSHDGYLVLLNPLCTVDIQEDLLLSQLESGTGPLNVWGKLARKYLAPLPVESTLQVLEGKGVSFANSSDYLNLQSNTAGLFQFTGATDGLTIAQSRLEQQFLRSQLLSSDEMACSLCRIAMPADLLVAGHIKPRSVMSGLERLDFGFNAMLVCVMGCDALYEKGYISVDNAGIVQSTQKVQGPIYDVITEISGKSCSKFGPQSAQYFAWHWQNVFRSAKQSTAHP